MKRTTVVLDDEDTELLDLAAKVHKVSKMEIIRRGIRHMAKEQRS